MATESNLQSSEGVRTYRGRTLEEILPQIREELGPDAIILREREGLVGGVGGFFAQRFIEVEARRGDESGEPRTHGPSIDIYDEEDDLGIEAASPAAELQRPLLTAGEPADEPLDISARRGTPVEPPERSQPRPFVPPEVRRERIIPRDPQGEPAAPTRRFETDVFLERLREASQVLPDEDEPSASVAEPSAPVAEPSAPVAEPSAPESAAVAEPDAGSAAEAQTQPGAEPEAQPAAEPEGSEPESRPRRPARRTPPERKPRAAQQRRPRPAPRTKPSTPKPAGGQPAPEQPQPTPVDPWTAAMAALVAEPEPEEATPPRAARRPAPRQPLPSQTGNPYEELRQRPPSLRAGLPTDSPAAPPAPPAAEAAPIPAPMAVSPLEIRERREGPLRSLISRLLGRRFASTTLPKRSPAHAIDAAAASAIAGELGTRGASQNWSGQLIGTAAAHGTALSGGLVAAVEAELARRIVPAPALPTTGAAVAFIGGGGTGKTRCTAALASAYSRASTLGVVVIAVDNPGGARELKRLLESDGVPVLSLNTERAAQAVAAYREGGFVIIDTPTTTPTDPAALDALSASLTSLELDATFVTLPATLGPQAARRALASFGRLNPSAVAITHADETDQLAVLVEIAITNRIPLAYLHAGTDHRSAISAVEAGALAQQLLAS